MTELGMALTNPMNVKDRKPGFVGIPFPSVRARIVKEGNCYLHKEMCLYCIICSPETELTFELTNQSKEGQTSL